MCAYVLFVQHVEVGVDFLFVHVCGHTARTKKACDEYVEQM